MRAGEFTKRTKFNVNETFEQGYPLEWEESDFGDYDAIAKLPDGTNLSILFSQEGSSNNESKWVVSFYRDNSTDITGQGDALKIFATVLDALEEFTYREDPDTIMFHAVKADDPKGSRAKLYDRMVKRYASHAGYNVQQQVDSEGAGYYLQKTKSMRESASK